MQSFDIYHNKLHVSTIRLYIPPVAGDEILVDELWMKVEKRRIYPIDPYGDAPNVILECSIAHP